MEIPKKNDLHDKASSAWHAINIIAFILLFAFSVLFSIIGYLTVEKLSSIDKNMIEFVKEQRDQDLEIQHLKDTKADKPNIK